MSATIWPSVLAQVMDNNGCGAVGGMISGGS
jgi:hypothetical protein